MARLGMPCVGAGPPGVAAHMMLPGRAGSAGGSEQASPAPDNNITYAGGPSKASIPIVDTAEDLLAK